MVDDDELDNSWPDDDAEKNRPTLAPPQPDPKREPEPATKPKRETPAVLRLDSAKEHMVERRVSEEFEGLKQEAQKLAAEIEKLFPQVEQIVAASDFGREAIDKARGIVTRARAAIDKKDTAALKEHIEGLSRTQRMFKGVVAKGQ